VAFLILPAGPLLAWKRGDLKGAGQRLAIAAGLALLCALAGWMAFEPRKAIAAGGIAIGAWLILGSLAEVVERVRLFRVPLAEVGRRAKALPLGAWGMTLAHAGLGVFVLGAVIETGFKVEAAEALSLGGTVKAGHYSVRLDQVHIVEGPNYLAEQGHLTVTPDSGGRPEVVVAERRFFPAGGQTTTEVGLDFRGLDDVYVVLGERRATPQAAQAWTVRVYWNPWARLIFLGPLIMALGGVLSLLDRRLRIGVAGRRKTVESVA
jgi:cytochrome c-type biogenesis protein CcmF